MSDNAGVRNEDGEGLRALAAALPGERVRLVVISGELRARNRKADIGVTGRMIGGRYAWDWGDGSDTEVIDADPDRAGYVAAVAARVCRVLDVEPACVDGPEGAG